jgi:hypothetical protein
MKRQVPGAPYKDNAQSVIETDESYTLDNGTDVVDATAAVTITLPPAPSVGQTHRIIASGGDVTVTAAASIVGNTSIAEGSAVEYAFSASGEWIATAGSGLAGGGMFGSDFTNFWGGDYDEVTGTWPATIGEVDVDDDTYEIPPAGTVNKHVHPTFNGVDEALVSPTVPTTLNGLSSYTVFTCFKVNGGDAYGSPFGIPLQFGFEFDNQHVYAYVNDGTGDDNIEGTSEVNDGLWHRAILTVENNEAKLYVDGNLEGTSTFTTLGTAFNVVQFGRQAGGIYFKGSTIGDGIITRAATAEEILQLDAMLSSYVKSAADPNPTVAVAALDIDWSEGEVFTKTLAAGANTLTFSNVPESKTIIVVLTGAASTVTWPAAVKWPGGTEPTQTASGEDVYTFVKAGATIYGSYVQDMQ